MEQLKLKVSPKGQITLPKKVRQQLGIGDYVYLNVLKDKAVLRTVSLVDELEDLIIRDVQREGYTSQEAVVKVKEKKQQLLEALDQELSQAVAEADEDYKASNTVTLWPRSE